MDKAAAIVLASDEGELEEAVRCIEEANRVFDALGDQRCSEDGWIRNHSRQVEVSLRAIDRVLAEAGKANNHSLESSLNSLRSESLSISTRFRNAITH